MTMSTLVNGITLAVAIYFAFFLAGCYATRKDDVHVLLLGVVGLMWVANLIRFWEDD